MKYGILAAMAVMTTVAPAQQANELKTAKDRYSYALGVDFATQLRGRAVDLDPEQFAAAMKTVLQGDQPLLNEKGVHEAIEELQAEIKRKQMMPATVPAAEALKQGQAFLAQNKQKSGVVVLPSGLQYKVLKAGSGKAPTDESTVTCQYKGAFVDGTEFDNSYASGPMTIALKDVIPGWKEALKLMNPGSKFQLVVPPQLAYGDKGSAPVIGPNATLVFEVELVAVR